MTLLVVTRIGTRFGTHTPGPAHLDHRAAILHRVGIPLIRSARVPVIWAWRTHPTNIDHAQHLARSIDLDIRVVPEHQEHLDIPGPVTSIRMDSDDGYLPWALEALAHHRLGDGDIVTFPHGWDVNLVEHTIAERKSASKVPGFLAAGRTPDNALDVAFHTRNHPRHTLVCPLRAHLRGIHDHNHSGAKRRSATPATAEATAMITRLGVEV